MKTSNFFFSFSLNIPQKYFPAFFPKLFTVFYLLIYLLKQGWQTCGIQQVDVLRSYSGSLL